MLTRRIPTVQPIHRVPRLCAVVMASIAFGGVSINAETPEGDNPSAVPRAHAHNDYYHAKPLLDALSHGFCSVEADIFLVDGKLLVAHSRSELLPANTLDALYLKPLQQRIQQNGGRVHSDAPEFTLLVDIKSSGKATYLALHEELARYADMLTTVTVSADGETAIRQGAVTVVVSGNRPRQTMAAQSVRHAGVDGRLSDLQSDTPAHLMPMISDNWRNHFRWRGEGEMPDDERDKLQSIVKQSHDAGRRVRFWATPEQPNLWKELLAADVDLINTDKLAELAEFLRKIR